jgi:hypothetical protein
MADPEGEWLVDAWRAAREAVEDHCGPNFEVCGKGVVQPCRHRRGVVTELSRLEDAEASALDALLSWWQSRKV